MKFYNYTIYPELMTLQFYLLMPLGYLLVGMILKVYLSRIKVDLTKQFMFVLVSFVHTTIMINFPKEYPPGGSLKISAHELDIYLIQIIIFRNVFLLDFYYMKKYLKEMVVITLANMALFMAINTWILLDGAKRDQWSFLALLIFCLAGINKVDFMRPFKEFEGMRVAISVLEGEFVIGACITHSIYCLSNQSKDYSEILLAVFLYVFLSMVVGIVFGYAASFLIIYGPMEYKNTVAGLIFLMYLICFVLDYAFQMSGTVTVTILALVVNSKRARYMIQTDECMNNAWTMISFFIEFSAYILIVTKDPNVLWHALSNITFKHISIVIMSEVSRFLACLLSYGLLYRVGKLKVRDYLVMFWFGKRGLVQVIYVLALFERFPEQEEKWLGCIVLILLVHVTINMFSDLLMRLFHLNVHSEEKIAHFVHCKRLIEKTKKLFVLRMKINRYLGDCKWSLIENYTQLLSSDQLDVETQSYDKIFTARKSFCNNCNKEIMYVPTPEQQDQMMHEAKKLIVFAYRMAVSHQYEIWFITKDMLRRMLQNMENNPDDMEYDLNIKDFISMCRNTKLDNDIKDTFELLTKGEKLRVPRQYTRRLVYMIVDNCYYELLMFLIVIGSIVVMYDKRISVRDLIYLYNSVLTGVFLADFLLKVYGYSFIYFKDGVVEYFSFNWNKYEIISLLCNIAMAVMAVYMTTLEDSEKKATMMMYCKRILFQITLLRVFRLAAVLYQMRYFIIKVCNKIINRRMGYGFSMGLGLFFCYKELLHMIPSLISNKFVSEVLTHNIETKFLTIYQEVFWLQNVIPNIAVDVKTKNILRVTMCHLRAHIKKLKHTGVIDKSVHDYMMETIALNNRTISSLGMLNVNTPTGIFNAQVWIQDKWKSEMFASSLLVTWRPGHLVMKRGKSPDGVYVIINGSLEQTYTPIDRILYNLKRGGCLPVGDLITSTKFANSNVRYVIPGHTIGLLSVITGRPYDTYIVTQTNCAAYFIPKQLIRNIMDREKLGTTYGLYNKIWETISLDMAANIIWSKPQYAGYTDEMLYFNMRKAYVLDYRREEFFVRTEEIDEIVLIEGIVEEIHQRQFYVGPCCLPRTTNKLRLDRTWCNPVLMIISLKEQ